METVTFLKRKLTTKQTCEMCGTNFAISIARIIPRYAGEKVYICGSCRVQLSNSFKKEVQNA